MTNTRYLHFLAFAAVLAISTAVVFALYATRQSVDASAPTGIPAQVATTSTLAVGPLNNMYAFGTTTRETAFSCASRIITTRAEPIMISFASLSSTTLTQTVGHLQAASTTAAYDSGLYGCGYVTVRGLNASTTIILTETK